MKKSLNPKSLSFRAETVRKQEEHYARLIKAFKPKILAFSVHHAMKEIGAKTKV